MHLRKSKADLLYENLVHNNQTETDAMIDFLRKESYALIVFRMLIDQCVDDDAYNSRFQLLKKHAEYIRRNKLLLIQNQFGLLEFHKKDYLNRFIKDIEKEQR